MHFRVALAAATAGLLLAASADAAAIYKFSFSGTASTASPSLTGRIGEAFSGSFTYEVPPPDSFAEDAITNHFLGGAVEFHLGADTWTGTVSNIRQGNWAHDNTRFDTNPNAAFGVPSNFTGPTLGGQAISFGLFELDHDGGTFDFSAPPTTTAGWVPFEGIIALVTQGSLFVLATSFDGDFTYAITLLDDGIPDNPPGGGTTDPAPIGEPGPLVMLAVGAFALAFPTNRRRLPARRIAAPALLAAALTALAACQAQPPSDTAAAPTASVARSRIDISGTWRGVFINNQGTSFPLSFEFVATEGRFTGTGNIPSSSYDTKPTVTGTVSGNRVNMVSSGGFRYDLTLNAEGTRLRGSVTGNNIGTLDLSR